MYGNTKLGDGSTFVLGKVVIIGICVGFFDRPPVEFFDKNILGKTNALLASRKILGILHYQSVTRDVFNYKSVVRVATTNR